MPTDIAETSPGMVTFERYDPACARRGIFEPRTGLVLMKLWVENAPRALLVTVLVIAVTGPLSWLAVIYLLGGPDPSTSALAGRSVVGPLIAFVAIPRLVFGPVLAVVEGAGFFLIRARLTRAVLAVAVLMELIPLGLYALHVVRTHH